jgi:FlaA1/EpsC-like NDP-sugar epimerase
MNSILITGGSGFLGQGLAREALKRGYHRVCIYSRGEHAQALMRESLENDPRLRWFIGDVRDHRRLARALHEVDVVVHAAALKRIEVGQYNPDELVKTNVMGTLNVIDACLQAGVDRLVLVSTDKAVAPVNAYGASKLLAEHLVLSAPAPLRTAVARYGNVAGSTGSVIPRWLADPASAILTDPECTRYWMSRRQAVELVLDLARDMHGGELVIPSLPAYRLGDLATAMGIEPRAVGLDPHEKRHETMDGITDSSQARRLTVNELRVLLEVRE